jgi:hypothetical protein
LAPHWGRIQRGWVGGKKQRELAFFKWRQFPPESTTLSGVLSYFFQGANLLDSVEKIDSNTLLKNGSGVNLPKIYNHARFLS